jgi:hypothetical protein
MLRIMLYLGSRAKKKKQEVGENSIMWSFTTYILAKWN